MRETDVNFRERGWRYPKGTRFVQSDVRVNQAFKKLGLSITKLIKKKRNGLSVTKIWKFSVIFFFDMYMKIWVF